MLARLVVAGVVAFSFPAHAAPSCEDRIVAVRQLGTGEGIPPTEPAVERETWLWSIQPSKPPIVQAGWKDVDRTSARLDVLSPVLVRYARSAQSSQELRLEPSDGRLEAELAKLPPGSVLVITADQGLPVSTLAQVVSRVPRHLEAGLAVRKPGKIIAAEHRRRYPASPPRVEEVLASASDEGGWRIMAIATKAYSSEMVRVARDCPAGSKVFERIVKGDGLHVVFPALAAAASTCGCEKLDLEATLSAVLFVTDVRRDQAFLPFASKKLPTNRDQTVAEYLRTIEP